MRKFPWLAPALILAAFLLAPAVARADSYQINIQLGDGSIVGTVTTNGASGGANGYIEIDSYSFDIVSGQVTGTSSGDRSGSAASINEINVEDDLTADGAHIYFNFSSGDSGYVAFQTILPNGALQYVCLGALVSPCILSDPEGVAVTNLNGDGVTDFQAETGKVIIGTVIPSPEPPASALLLIGALFTFMFVRRKCSPISSSAQSRA